MSRTSEDAGAGRTPYAAGFACIVGRPNAGKSTLTNALVGSKVAITSSKPQTTRHTIRGIVTTPESQLVLVDTPGLHKPRTLLGERLNDLVRQTLLEVDVIGFCLPSDQRIGPGDAFIARELAEIHGGRRTPVVAIATKSDLVDRERLAEHLIAVDRLGDWAAIVPCSATSGAQVDEVAAELCAHLPPSPAPLYPEGVLTDEPEAVMIAELVREAALEGVRDELPHSLAVVVEELVAREGRSLDEPPARRARQRLRGASVAEGDRHRPRWLAAARGRDQCAPGHRGPPRTAGPSRPARQGRQGLAARPQAAAAPRVLTPAAPGRAVLPGVGAGPGGAPPPSGDVLLPK